MPPRECRPYQDHRYNPWNCNDNISNFLQANRRLLPFVLDCIFQNNETHKPVVSNNFLGCCKLLVVLCFDQNNIGVLGVQDRIQVYFCTGLATLQRVFEPLG
jgi:hypothetical protein